MRIDFNLSNTEGGKFRIACEAVLRNVGEGTKAATEDAAVSIMTESINQVPVETGTLLSSAFLGVSRRTDTKGYRYGAVLGYGDSAGLRFALLGDNVQWIKEPSNPVNPKHGLPASAYAGTVHEDLEVHHANGGKAKFLEDPIREWASGRFARTAMTYWGREIERSNAAGEPVWHSRKNGKFYTNIDKWASRKLQDALDLKKTYHGTRVTTNYKWTVRGKSVQRYRKSVYKGEDQ